MKYITTFETEAAYNAAKDNLITPNVSYIEETNGVAYKPLVAKPMAIVVSEPYGWDCGTLVDGQASGGTMYYALGQYGGEQPPKEYFYPSIPSVPPSPMGYQFTIWWYVKGDENHSDTEIQSFTCQCSGQDMW